ncbi:hypothetical protein [uncultured Piscinibacter sp.]|uniref:FFLEELY motif protein n=1 Tax=uncultured Piscinibacter sp. TaxID=1131835 RepID=UPI0026215112|nr:hypothetical protein [uncultured Piscinibacter sp.]
MPADARSILAQLDIVSRERELRAADPLLALAVVKLKEYQQRRFCLTYADLLASPRYAAASRFFLDELYGPKDFSERDAQFARVVPALVRLFPREIVETVDVLARLHALSETLDTTMARQLIDRPVDRRSYLLAWQATGDEASRERQIALTLTIGRELDRLTRKPLLRRTLHLMRGPARAAGLPALQQFLETGFDTFKDMGGADTFLSTVGERERRLARVLFEARPQMPLPRSPSALDPLGQLP